MATRGKSGKHRQKHANTAFELPNMDSVNTGGKPLKHRQKHAKTASELPNMDLITEKEKPLKHRQKSLNATFESSSADSNAVEENIFEEYEDDRPAVFICAKCRLPVGDSLSWDGSEDGHNQIRLKRITENVLVGEENHMIEVSKRVFCLVVDLICRGCQSVLGMVYTSTPESMDHKRFTFCLNVADIDSYVLGSTSQVFAAEGPKEQPVTLEYAGIVEQQLTEMKVMVLTMAQKLEDIEAGLQEGCDETCQ